MYNEMHSLCIGLYYEQDGVSGTFSLEISWVNTRTGVTERCIVNLTLPQKLTAGQRYFSDGSFPRLEKAVLLAEFVELRNALVL